ncbi:hypothetical protein [Devosia sp.]|nr:hypothetical protein [Devosia sp.]
MDNYYPLNAAFGLALKRSRDRRNALTLLPSLPQLNLLFGGKPDP